MRDGITEHDKWPHQYAGEILELPTREERQAAIEQVPECIRELVKSEVRSMWMKKHHKGTGQPPKGGQTR